MSLQLTLPFGNQKNLKNLVFTILTKEYPLKLIELHNTIKRRYGRSVTYQAVRKAALELLREGVLEEQQHSYSIRKNWVIDAKQTLERIEQELRRGPRKHSASSETGELTVYEFPTLNALMGFWQENIDQWLRERKKGVPGTNYYQAPHAWEALVHPKEEEEVMRAVTKSRIETVTIITNTTPLDYAIKEFYKGIGVDTTIREPASSFDKGYYVGTYDDLIISTTLPDELVKEIDAFFHQNTDITKLRIDKLTAITKQKILCKLTIVKNAQMANHVNASIRSLIRGEK